jgi:hypothetical protein
MTAGGVSLSPRLRLGDNVEVRARAMRMRTGEGAAR